MYEQENQGGEVNDVDYIKKALIKTIDGYAHFTLNDQAIASLDIVPKLKPDGLPDTSSMSLSRSSTTIFSVLNKCRTQPGQRLLAFWLQNPLMSKKHIDERQDIVEYFMSNSEIRATCYDDYLRKIPDLLRIACRIARERCSIRDLVKIYHASKSASTLFTTFNHISSTSDQEAPKAVVDLFKWMNQSSYHLKDFEKLLEDSLMLDKLDENNDYLLRPQANDDIAKITEELNSLVRRARDEMVTVANDVGVEPDKGVKLEIDATKGFDMRVTRQNEQLVRNNSEYIQASQIKKDGYRFTTRVLSRLSDKYVGTKAEYASIAKDVYHDIISRAVMYDDQVLELCMSYTVLDVFVALAVAADTNNYARPLILDSEAGKIEMERLRHPCVENQPDIENYVPNDIMLSKYDKKFFIVTGPNMGGKSTYIKSIAAAVIMALCGSSIPAEDGKISIIDHVYTRIGAGDRQAEGISTFMEEMLEMQNILAKATENSLVIIDELGRGTSTFDGFGLAWAITKHLASQIKCYGVFATHFHELTEMENEIPSVGNLHVKAYCQDDKLSLLYNVDRGVCDESYGINVARYTKFPQHVIEMATEKLKQFEEVPGFESKKELKNFVQDCVRELLTKN
uniref:DNA mismatch repair protein Msh2 n=1 Tax=Aceria tosichella TaxID=561515 RepID=A0A6G1SEJ7_9ACAR